MRPTIKILLPTSKLDGTDDAHQNLPCPVLSLMSEIGQVECSGKMPKPGPLLQKDRYLIFTFCHTIGKTVSLTSWHTKPNKSTFMPPKSSLISLGTRVWFTLIFTFLLSHMALPNCLQQLALSKQNKAQHVQQKRCYTVHCTVTMDVMNSFLPPLGLHKTTQSKVHETESVH